LDDLPSFEPPLATSTKPLSTTGRPTAATGLSPLVRRCLICGGLVVGGVFVAVVATALVVRTAGTVANKTQETSEPESIANVSSIDQIGADQVEGREALLAEAAQADMRLQQHFQRGEYRQAAEAGERALAIRHKFLGDHHEDTATSLGNLGTTYLVMADYAKAEPLLVHGLQVRKAVSGDRHPETANALNSLGELYRQTANYAKAEGLLLQSVEICRAHYLEAHPRTANFLNTLGELYKTMGQLEKAEPLLLESLTIIRKVRGNDHPETALCLNSIAGVHFANGEYPKAAALLDESLGISRNAFGEMHPDVALGLGNLAECNRMMGKYEEAESQYHKALEIQEKVFGRGHPATSNSIRNLGVFYFSTGQYAKAEPLMQRSLELARASLGLEHPDTGGRAHDLAAVYQEMGEYAKAEPLYRQSVEIRKKALGSEHPDTAHSLSGLAGVCHELGRMDEAESLLREALETIRPGEEHPSTADCLNRLAMLHDAVGQYGKAKSEYQQSLQIRKRVFGDEHLNTAQSLSNLGVLYYRLGEYREAEPLFRESLRITRKLFGPLHLKTATSANNLAELCRAMGDYAEAEALFRQALQIRRKELGDQHPDTAGSLNNLGLLYQQTGDERSEQMLAQALEVVRNAYGPEHPETVTCLNNMALLYQARGAKDLAEPLLQKCLAIQEEAFGDVHPRTAASMSNLACFYWSVGELDAAEAMCRRSLKIRRQIFGDLHVDTAGSLLNLAPLLLGTNRFDEAEAAYAEALAIHRRHLEHTFDVLTERQRLLLTRQSRSALNGWLNAAERAGLDDSAIYERVLQWKGIVHARQVMERIRFDHPALAADRDRLRAISGRLATLAMKPPETMREAAEWREGISTLTQEKERLERRFARASSEYRVSSEASVMTPAVLSELLPADTALVDFLEYTHFDADKLKDGKAGATRKLVAFIVAADRPVVKIDLGVREAIGVATLAWRDRGGRNEGEYDAGAVLRRLVWQPIQDHLSDVATVLVSPDGPLHALPFAGLPGSEPGTYLVEEYAIATIPVPALLPTLYAQSEASRNGVRDRSKTDTKRTPSLLVIGDADYGGDPGAAIGSVQRAPIEKEEPNWSRELATSVANANIRHEMLAVRESFQSRFADGAVQLLRRQDATESGFHQQAPQHRWLHIATHGYFAQDASKSALELTQGEDIGGMQREDRTLSGYHPGLLSGLVLTGVERRAGPGQDDGILTALEVQAMDLSDVDVAVLSACETGRGKVAGGEGVLGLQRAFQIAGAKTTVATLWMVEDYSTSRIMEKFYENLWERNMTKLEALRQAQLWWMKGGQRQSGGDGVSEQRRNERLPPESWAGFVLAGAWW